jgi:hypothetical protein
MKKLFVFFCVLCIATASSFNSVYAQQTADKPTSRTIEDGGTGPYKAIMLSEATLPTHTVFRPKDLSAFGLKK